MTAYDLEDRAAAAEDLAPISRGGSGQEIAITSHREGPYDAVTRSITSTTVVQIGSGIVLERTGMLNQPNSLILAGDKQVLLSALDSQGQPLNPPPAVNDRVEFAGSVYSVTLVAPMSPAGTPIYFDLNVRGAS